MTAGEWLTRASVWLALMLYVAGQWARKPTSGSRPAAARWLDGLGFFAFLVHVFCAFQFHHHWSHAAAEAETARQTDAIFGWNWGGGLYFNYAFGLVWLLAVTRAWRMPDGAVPPVDGMAWATRGFFLLMIANGAVVFALGPMRWVGVVLCLLLLAAWWPTRRTRLGN